MAKQSGGPLPANTPMDVRALEKITVYAASTSVVSMSADMGATYPVTVTVPGAGYVTISDFATHIKVNNSSTVLGLYAHSGD